MSSPMSAAEAHNTNAPHDANKEQAGERPTDQPEPRPRAPLTARPLILLVRLYQASLRPVMGMHCRFQPTCSDYAVAALTLHGAIRGTWLTVRRLLRCHPFGGFGYDPVPPRREHGRSAPAQEDDP